MQFLTLFIICSVTLNDFVVKTLDLPPPLRFLPEFLSMVVILYVSIVGTRDRFQLVAPKYWFAFGIFTLLIVCGVINAQPGAGPILSGMRFYLRAVPLFLLPAVLSVSEKQLMRQLKLILALSLVQVPIAVYQRYVVLSEGRATGDEVRGTLMDSGILSIFLICVVLVLTGLLLKNRIGRFRYAGLFFTVLAPTTINETKGTLLLLPFGLIVTLLMGSTPGKRLRYATLTLAGLIAFGAIFFPIYNMMEIHNPHKNEKDLTNFFTNQKQLGRYLSSDVSGVGTAKDVRRGDAIVVPLQFLSRDPAELAFGLGIGSVSPSNFGKNFQGAYYLLFKKFLITSLTFFILEFGVLGVIMIGVLAALVFFDTLYVARNDNSLTGSVAAGWTGVVALVAVSMVYTIFHEFTSVNYLYWYFSGVMCARRVALAESSVVARAPVAQERLNPTT
jgi:hypothetical protein